MASTCLKVWYGARMALTPQQHLDLIDAVIEERLGSGAVEAYSEAYDKFRGTSLKDLFEIRTSIRQELAASGSGGNACFRLAEFMGS